MQNIFMNNYFFSDPHAYHKNIVRGITSWPITDKTTIRPFDTMDEMMTTMINNINATVGAYDRLFCLGDWSFGGIENALKFREQINCKNISLICGNHDNKHDTEWNPIIPSIKKNVSTLFDLYVRCYELYICRTSIVLFHYPIASWKNMSKGALMLHGHTHRSPQDRFINGGKSMDVGIDGHPEFRPYHIDEIFELLNSRSIITEGHH